MFSGQLAVLNAAEHTRDLLDFAARRRRPIDGYSRPTRVTLRYSSSEDGVALHSLAKLDSAPTPSGRVLVAEVDGRLRAALPLDGSAAIAGALHRDAGLIELLRLRAAQLRRA